MFQFYLFHINEPRYFSYNFSSTDWSKVTFFKRPLLDFGLFIFLAIETLLLKFLSEEIEIKAKYLL